MAKKNEEIGGIWRTIGGRRVFIKDGQDLATAMKESGKFKSSSKKPKIGDERDKKFDNYLNKYKDKTEGELRRIIHESNDETEKMSANKLLNDMKEEDKNIAKKLKENRTTAQINKEYEELSKKMQQDDYYYKSEDDRKLKELRAEYDSEVAKGKLDIRNGNDYLPKETKIETQGKSNRAEVSNNIQAHILSYYDNPVDFMEQMDAMDYLPTKWRAGEKLAEGGSYLIYNGDMSDFLNELKINPKGKKFSEDKSFQMYTSLIGRESERLYNRLEKLYNQYKAEHKNSDVSLDDFRKWFE